jgi:hypothetical protein
MTGRTSNPHTHPGRSFRYWTTALVLILGLLTIVSASVGSLAVEGIASSLAVGLLLVVVGLVILLVDVLGAIRQRETSGVMGAGRAPDRGVSLFVLGLSLTLSGMICAWTGVLWFAMVALWPPLVFRPEKRS